MPLPEYHRWAWPPLLGYKMGVLAVAPPRCGYMGRLLVWFAPVPQHYRGSIILSFVVKEVRSWAVIFGTYSEKNLTCGPFWALASELLLGRDKPAEKVGGNNVFGIAAPLLGYRRWQIRWWAMEAPECIFAIASWFLQVGLTCLWQ